MEDFVYKNLVSIVPRAPPLPACGPQRSDDHAPNTLTAKSKSCLSMGVYKLSEF